MFDRRDRLERGGYRSVLRKCELLELGNHEVVRELGRDAIKRIEWDFGCKPGLLEQIWDPGTHRPPSARVRAPIAVAIADRNPIAEENFRTADDVVAIGNWGKLGSRVGVRVDVELEYLDLPTDPIDIF